MFKNTIEKEIFIERGITIIIFIIIVIGFYNRNKSLNEKLERNEKERIEQRESYIKNFNTNCINLGGKIYNNESCFYKGKFIESNGEIKKLLFIKQNESLGKN